MSKTNPDIMARQLREKLERLVLGDDDAAIVLVARAMVAHCQNNPEYALCRMWPPDETPVVEAPKRIASRYEGRCKRCNAFVVPGEEVWWMPGEKGVSCIKCGGG